MNEQERHDLFSELITHHQSELYGYIFSVVRNWEDADDLFQSVCVVLWSKFEAFRPGTSFFAWARQTAKIKISDFLRHKGKFIGVSENVLNVLAEVAVKPQDTEEELYLAALRRCRAKLAGADEELLTLHYVDDLGSRQIADRLQRSQASVCHSLKRIRHLLFKCVQVELVQHMHSEKECT